MTRWTGLLFRRRTVWLPTAGFALLVVVVLAAATIAIGRHLGDWLAVTARAAGPAGGGARTLVVEGWMDEHALDAAVAVHRLGHYDRILVSGGPIEDLAWNPRWKTYPERAADFLAGRGLAPPVLVAVPAPASAQDRTFLSAVVVRDWMTANAVPLDAVDLVSAGVHARRSRQVFRMAFGPQTEVGVVAVRGRDEDPAHWWRTSRDAKAAMGELLSIAWTACCFHPAPRGSHEERWAVPAKP